MKLHDHPPFRMTVRRRLGRRALAGLRCGLGAWRAFGLILAFLLLFLIVPVGAVIYTAFVNETGSLTVGHFANFFGQLVFRESFSTAWGGAIGQHAVLPASSPCRWPP